MKVLYDASANFDIENVDIDVGDDSSEQDIWLAIVSDLESRYRLRVSWEAEKGENAQ